MSFVPLASSMSKGDTSRPFDRAAMIEAASRSLRQQMGRAARERPRSKGSLHDTRATSLGGERVARGGERGFDNALFRGEPLVGDDHPPAPRSAENAQRRIRSAENDHHRMMYAVPREAAYIASTPAVVDGHPADEAEAAASASGPPEDVPNLNDLKRPLSRKKDPSASAAAGLGAFSSPMKMTDAFEQRKMRQPIPVESWGPRPPSRHGLPPKAVVNLQASLSNTEEPKRGRADSSSATSSVVGGTWAAARYDPTHEVARRGRERKARDARGSPEDLGVWGSSAGFGSGQQLSKSLSGVFDHSSDHRENREPGPRPESRPSSLTSPAGTGSIPAGPGGSWASHVDFSHTHHHAVGITGGANAPAAAANGPPAGLEVSGCAFGESTGASWPSSPAAPSSGGGSPGSAPLLVRRGGGARHCEAVSVEDVEGGVDLDPMLHIDHIDNSYRRDATPPQVIVTRSSQQKKDRTDSRRVRGRPGAATPSERDKNIPFTTSLDVDFLSLFAS